MFAELQSALDGYRASRRFNAEQYVHTKSLLLNAYFTQNAMSGCVVGLSGGVDSAVTLGIISHAARQPGSPIRRILAVLLPMHGEGATHQNTALSRGAEVAAAFDVPCVTIDLSSTLAVAREASLAGTGTKGTAWASGQLVSYLRTPMLYYQTALLSEQGFPSVLCGTTNRDEGSYIGFFGKASDGMVDIQLISDVHKSEVYKVATQLGVPHSVCVAVPTGDTYDGACDEEMIGAPYDALELYTWYLCTDPVKRELWHSSLCLDTQHEFHVWTKKFERLHRVNSHKYIGDSPAVHFDIYARAVPGGWRTQEIQPLPNPMSQEAALAVLVGPIKLNRRIKHTLSNSPSEKISTKSLADFGDSAVLLSNVLSQEICEEFIRDTSSWQWVQADLHGKALTSHGNDTLIGDKNLVIGSYRATAYDEEIAQLLWNRLAPFLPALRLMDDFAHTDWKGHPVWRPVGINPVLRFIRYEKGGALVPHYDAGFDFKDGSRHTLMSVVITLTPPSHDSGGNTRFLVDQQRFLPLDERNHADLNELASSYEVLVEAPAKCGDVLVFDHRILHDGSTWNEAGSRIILRTDIIFERCSPHVIKPSECIAPPLPDKKWTRDPILRKAYGTLGDVAPIEEESGYFDDGLEDVPHFDPKLWSAPFDKILKSLTKPKAQEASSELFVLVTTGAFCPIHEGHIQMMERAKLALEERGHVVLGGYFAPDHDDYVSRKCGAEAVPAPIRLDLCERATSNSDWLMVDRWAALHVPTAINYTTIIERLQKYLSYHVRTHRPIHVAFVFGSDNAGFAMSFVGRGSCVCVLRTGYERELDRYARHPAVRRNPRIVFSTTATSPWASSSIRQGNFQALPEEVRHEWIRLRTLNEAGESNAQNFASIYVRNEGDWAIQPWAGLSGMKITDLSIAYQTFLKGLVDTLEQAFSRGRKLDGGTHVGIVIIDLKDQQALFQDLANSNSVISLDPCLPSETNVEISRCFEPLSKADPVFVARPGSDSLTAQLERLSHDKSYILFDDDTFSGHTSAYVQRLVKEKCIVEKFVTLGDANGPLGAKPSEYPPRLNLVDCRDFLVGAREAGLVLKLPDGSLCRVPYMLPYVRPNYHASILVTEEISFSRHIWQLNKQFFSSLGTRIYLSDMSPAFQRLCTAQRFPASMLMEDFCDWHLEQLI